MLQTNTAISRAQPQSPASKLTSRFFKAGPSLMTKRGPASEATSVTTSRDVLSADHPPAQLSRNCHGAVRSPAIAIVAAD